MGDAGVVDISTPTHTHKTPKQTHTHSSQVHLDRAVSDHCQHPHISIQVHISLSPCPTAYTRIYLQTCTHTHMHSETAPNGSHVTVICPADDLSQHMEDHSVNTHTKKHITNKQINRYESNTASRGDARHGRHIFLPSGYIMILFLY